MLFGCKEKWEIIDILCLCYDMSYPMVDYVHRNQWECLSCSKDLRAKTFLTFQVLFRTTTRWAPTRPSKPWTGSRWARSGSKFSWRDRETSGSRTEQKPSWNSSQTFHWREAHWRVNCQSKFNATKLMTMLGYKKYFNRKLWQTGCWEQLRINDNRLKV